MRHCKIIYRAKKTQVYLKNKRKNIQAFFKVGKGLTVFQNSISADMEAVKRERNNSEK